MKLLRSWTLVLDLTILWILGMKRSKMRFYPRWVLPTEITLSRVINPLILFFKGSAPKIDTNVEYQQFLYNQMVGDIGFILPGILDAKLYSDAGVLTYAYYLGFLTQECLSLSAYFRFWWGYRFRWPGTKSVWGSVASQGKLRSCSWNRACLHFWCI